MRKPELWIVLFCAALAFGCDDKKKASPEEPTEESPSISAEGDNSGSAAKPSEASAGDASTLDEASAEALFPASVGDYSKKGFKVKDYKGGGKAYSATYKSADKELKLVINDVPPRGLGDWDEFKDQSKSKTKGHMAFTHPKGEKVTHMVFVGERFRVDFKSRQEKGPALEQLAKGFDFGPVEKLAK